MNRKPIIEKSSFWADFINMFCMRSVYRPKPKPYFTVEEEDIKVDVWLEENRTKCVFSGKVYGNTLSGSYDAKGQAIHQQEAEKRIRAIARAAKNLT